jgi:DNA-binding beta-propeller fold protein YncE
VTGQCSGGLCGELDSDAAVALFAAGGPEAAEGATTDDALLLSGLPGGWVELAAIGNGTAPTGLEYATLRGVLYAVNPLAGDDELITIDPDTGARASTIGTLSGKQQVIALAFDPGDTDAESDDRLLALDRVGSFEDLFEIDPDDASLNDLGGLNLGVTGGFQGLAYDSINDKLYASGFAGTGLYEIDLACPSFCFMSSVPGLSVARRVSSLAFSEETGRLYLVGSQTGPRTLYDSIDATTLEALPTIGIDDYTPGGLAAIPVPEPNARLMLSVGALALAALARSRTLTRTRA